MRSDSIKFLDPLMDTIRKIQSEKISENRIAFLKPLISYIQQKIDSKENISLNFICTHNSRRSQFSQIWAFAASNYFEIPIKCFSGGVEVTEFNYRAVESIKRSGFKVKTHGENNPKYIVSLDSGELYSIETFSKLFDDSTNSATNFAAIMTCSHADENCPIIPGAEARIPVRYEDPKEFDNTAKEEEMYDKRSLQIATEMFYVFSKIKKSS